MIRKDERLMPMLLRPQGSGSVLGTMHLRPALIVEAQDGGHHVAAG